MLPSSAGGVATLFRDVTRGDGTFPCGRARAAATLLDVHGSASWRTEAGMAAKDKRQLSDGVVHSMGMALLYFAQEAGRRRLPIWCQS